MTAINPFLQRIMERPVPEILRAGPSDRHFYDPPELIQQAFGGRQWFWDTGCKNIHRVGIFKGLAWQPDSSVTRQDERGINLVRVTTYSRALSRIQLYTIEFLVASQPEDLCAPVVKCVVDHRAGLTIDQLKRAYAEVLGEHAL